MKYMYTLILFCIYYQLDVCRPGSSGLSSTSIVKCRSCPFFLLQLFDEAMFRQKQTPLTKPSNRSRCLGQCDVLIHSEVSPFEVTTSY
jgi:hypothetical protein